MKTKTRLSTPKAEAKSNNTVTQTRRAPLPYSENSPVDRIMFLQRTVGNQAVQRMFNGSAKGGEHGAKNRVQSAESKGHGGKGKEQGAKSRVQSIIQAKLKIGQPNDKFEQEADRVAEKVMSMARPAFMSSVTSAGENQQAIYRAPISIHNVIQKQASSFPEDAEEQLKKEKKIQRKGNAPSTATPALEHRLNSQAGAGHTLPLSIKTFMENGFGSGFDSVRIHTDSEAVQMNRDLKAEAFTYGKDIFFGAGKYEPKTQRGAKLLAHELTHTIQQSALQRKAIQFRGGLTVGHLDVCSNVINAGLTAGHAWLAYTPTGGAKTTYGTWGNRMPIGLHRNLELANPIAASRRTALDATDHTALTTFAAANNDWGYINNCASFAGRGWRSITGESVSYRNMLGIPNPSSLGEGIVAANGGAPGGTLAGAPAGGGSSTGSSF